MVARLNGSRFGAEDIAEEGSRVSRILCSRGFPTEDSLVAAPASLVAAPAAFCLTLLHNTSGSTIHHDFPRAVHDDVSLRLPASRRHP